VDELLKVSYNKKNMLIPRHLSMFLFLSQTYNICHENGTIRDDTIRH
jgi:hypothetical protein